ncbi:MAG TPA: zinc dependent phospholipase C family protein [Flavisolibacter sp.]|nr:zinc dependent phospholipase C family protein [Flavisolibacter sp.]
MKNVQSKLVLMAALVVLVVCSSWGFLMHRTLIQLSVYQLPAEMQPFFYQNREELVRHSVRPDQRRNTDNTEDTKHFIDFEAYGKNAASQMPTKWQAAVRRYSEDTLLKYGYAPYWVVEMQKRLTAAFRKGNKDSILFYATDLAHYIHDAHVPLHTTLNYDGQLTNQKGLHSLWESMVPELTLNEFDLRGNKKATYLQSAEKAIWKAVRQAHTLVPNLLEAERRVSRQFTDSTKYRTQTRNGKESRSYTSAFGRAYAKALEPTVNRQAIRAANLVSDFWYTAWVDAGKPNLQKMLTKSWSKSDSKQLQQEVDAYNKNELLKKDLLLSKKE